MAGRRLHSLLGFALVMVALAIPAGAAWYCSERWPTQPDPTPAPVTSPVELTTLTNQLRLNAQTSYGEATPLPEFDGMITALPHAGDTVTVGQEILEVDGRPVILFRGERPFWRELARGSAGADVTQLQENLTELGFYEGAADGTFGSGTRAAVVQWQKSLGVKQTGVFSPNHVVVTPSESIKIASLNARLGEQQASAGTYTSTVLSAKATLTEAQARGLIVGTLVMVQLGSGGELEATLESIDLGGQALADGGTTSPSATFVFADQEAIAQEGAGSVRIVISDDSEQTPTLVVPATALIATADGGYAVEIYENEQIARVPVEIGRVADSRVQIVGSGNDTGSNALTEGDQVVLSQ